MLRTNIEMEDLHEWRANELWTLDVNDCFEANIGHLKQIYGQHLNKQTPLMTLEIATKVFTQETQLLSAK